MLRERGEIPIGGGCLKVRPNEQEAFASDEVPARQVVHRKRFFNDDDEELKWIARQCGTKDWSKIGSIMIIKRTNRECCNRWNLYLAPEINRQPWTTADGEELLERQHKLVRSDQNWENGFWIESAPI
jgi:hypothetical protein